MDTFRKFVRSYAQIKKSLARPVVFYDGEDPEYLKLLEKLEPAQLIAQPETGIQRNICFNLPKIMTEQYPGEMTLFLEDDILFSSKFPSAVRIVEDRMGRYSKVGLVTFYGNGGCYWPPKNNNFMYRFSGHEYYGNLCLAIKPKVMEWWAANLEKVWRYPAWGWDLKIGQMFEIQNFGWYCTKKHYVQHQAGLSAIAGVHKRVHSKLFVS